MKAICDDGITIECGGFTPLQHGVVLTEDRARNRAIGFVPYDRIEYVLPDRAVEPDDAAGGRPTAEGRLDEAEEVRARLQRLEERFEDLRRSLAEVERGEAPVEGADTTS